MIDVPNRLSQIRDAIEKGEPVDWDRFSLLSTLDIAIAQQDFVKDAVKRNEEFDDELEKFGREIINQRRSIP